MRVPADFCALGLEQFAQDGKVVLEFVERGCGIRR
jgi:hypothetical protein